MCLAAVVSDNYAVFCDGTIRNSKEEATQEMAGDTSCSRQYQIPAQTVGRQGTDASMGRLHLDGRVAEEQDERQEEGTLHEALWKASEASGSI